MPQFAEFVKDIDVILFINQTVLNLCTGDLLG